MKSIKVYVVGGATGYANFIENKVLVDSVEEADLVLFTGGEDVTPSIYGCKKHRSTFCNIDRDVREKEMFNKVKPNQLVVGICRGSQLLCALNGGLLVQNCRNHGIGSTHQIINNEGEVYHITSTHHQMQYPYNLNPRDYTLLFISNGNRSDIYEGDKIDPEELISRGEPEIVLYHKKGKAKCLAIQGHPEYMGPCAIVTKINALIDKYLEKK